AVGAAVANSTAQIVGSVPLAIYAGRCVGGLSLSINKLVRAAVVAAVAGGAAAVPIVTLPPPVAIPPALLAFVAVPVPAAMMLAPMSPEDTAWLKDATPAAFTAPVLGLVRLVSGMRARLAS